MARAMKVLSIGLVPSSRNRQGHAELSYPRICAQIGRHGLFRSRCLRQQYKRSWQILKVFIAAMQVCEFSIARLRATCFELGAKVEKDEKAR